jgi:transposase
MVNAPQGCAQASAQGVYHVIGIDVSKHTLAVCRWDSAQPEPCWERTYPNSEQGLRQLLGDTPADMPWVLEPTGCYSELAVRLGQGADRLVLTAPPLAAKRFLQSLNPRAKTDRVDARGLARYAKHASLRPFRLKEAPLQRLWELLQVRCGLARSLEALRQQVRALPEAAPLAQPTIEHLQARLKAFEEEIEKAGQELDLFVRLDGIIGVGPLTAAALTVRLMSIDFASYDAFVAYVGLDLRICDSGKHQGKRRLSKHGDAQLRWLLYLAAKATLSATKDTGFKELYERKCAEGGTTTGSICIVARKIAKVAWSLARSGERYDPARVFCAQPA